MKEIVPRWRLLLPVLLSLLAGCATTNDFGCDMHETRMREAKPVTTYQAVSPKPGQLAPRVLPAGVHQTLHDGNPAQGCRHSEEQRQ